MLLRRRLPQTAIISIGHRSTLAAFHTRRFMVVGEGNKRRLVEKDPPKLVPTSGAA
jgi:putative ATP-binding cassette transporter